MPDELNRVSTEEGDPGFDDTTIPGEDSRTDNINSEEEEAIQTGIEDSRTDFVELEGDWENEITKRTQSTDER